MKPPRKSFAALYTEWLSLGWTTFTRNPPLAPAKALPPKAAQAAAVQEWEDEGGSIKPAQKPGAAAPGETKIPF